MGPIKLTKTDQAHFTVADPGFSVGRRRPVREAQPSNAETCVKTKKLDLSGRDLPGSANALISRYFLFPQKAK